jgi:hypothetical protein
LPRVSVIGSFLSQERRTRAANRGDERVLRARFLTSPIRYLSAQGFQDSGVYATFERQPFECAQPLLSRVATRFRLDA